MPHRWAVRRCTSLARWSVERGGVAAGDLQGQGMVEYALLVAFIGLVVIITLAVLGHQVNNTYSNIGNGIVSQ